MAVARATGLFARPDNRPDKGVIKVNKDLERAE